MRLNPVDPAPMVNPIAGHATLDEILGHNAARNGDAPALLLPGAAQRSWREVDGAVSALARIFADWRLGDDAIVGVQLGSGPEAAATCLALWRAGLTAALLPLPWRRREIGAALGSLGARAIVTLSRGGGADLGEIACEIAAGLDAIRFVGCFGPDVPDGATPLDDRLAEPAEGPSRAERPKDAADHIAVITFEAGGAPVARSHNELLAAALTPLAASRLSSQSALVSTLDLAGLAGLSTGLAPWLASCCAASFHQPSTTLALARAIRDADASHLVLPGRIAAELAQDGAFDPSALSAVTLVWRAPDGRASSIDFGARTALVDASYFGELGVHAALRPAGARFAALPLGEVGPEGFPPLAEFRLGQDGRLAIRGAICPCAPFPAAPDTARIVFGADGFLDTGLAGLADRDAGRASLGGRRRGVIHIGGLALSQSDVDQAYRRSGAGSVPLAQDDPLFGTRLVLGPKADGAEAGREGVAALIDAAGFTPALAPVEPQREPVRRSA